MTRTPKLVVAVAGLATLLATPELFAQEQPVERFGFTVGFKPGATRYALALPRPVGGSAVEEEFYAARLYTGRRSVNRGTPSGNERRGRRTADRLGLEARLRSRGRLRSRPRNFPKKLNVPFSLFHRRRVVFERRAGWAASIPLDHRLDYDAG